MKHLVAQAGAVLNRVKSTGAMINRSLAALVTYAVENDKEHIVEESWYIRASTKEEFGKLHNLIDFIISDIKDQEKKWYAVG